MDLAVLDNRKQRACRFLAVECDLDALHRTAEALGLADMYVISGAGDRNLYIELRVILPEERFYP